MSIRIHSICNLILNFNYKSHIRTLTFCKIKDIHSSKNSAGNNAELKGWVRAVRKMKNNIFVDLDDGSASNKLQIIIPKDVVPKGLTYGSSIETSGQLVINSQNQIELIPDKLKVVGSCNVMDGYPFAPRKFYPPDYVRNYLHLRPRTRSFSSLLRVRHYAIQALNKYFCDSGFYKIDVPILTSNDCEGAGEVFIVEPNSQTLINEMCTREYSPEESFFNGKTYLTVSGQFHLEVAARAMNNVYCFGPTFRAENSKSRLHLSEFYMAEAELAFTENLDDVLKLIEGLIKSVSYSLMDTCADDICACVKPLDIEHMLLSPFTIDSYHSVSDILEKHSINFKVPFRKGEPLSKEHELFLVEHNNNVPFFVIDWPAKIKPFYMKSHKLDHDKVFAVDLLCSNVGELCGGSLREDNYDILETKLKQNNLEDKLAWYLELRKFGNVPSGGFGLGFERFLQLILGIDNIKDAIPFPRSPHNCKL